MEKKLGRTVDRYGLIGRNIDYSFSRGYFKKKFLTKGIGATYQNFDISKSEQLKELLKNEIVKGFNVTIPYKETVIPLLDRLDPAAKTIGAVNTIKRELDGSLSGFNTDYLGFRESLLEKFKFTLLRREYDESTEEMKLEFPNSALILGTGGASKAVYHAFRSFGINCTFVSRKRREFSETLVIAYDDLTEDIINDTTFIVNTTPLGTYPSIHLKPAISYDLLTDAHVAYDLIYNPAETAFLRLASEQGATTLNGLRMLELQAEASWKIWNTEPIP